MDEAPHANPVIGQPSPGQPAPARQARRGWWSRNWGWVACGSVLSVVLMCIGLFAVVSAVLTGVIQTTEVYRQSVVAAQEDPWVQDQLGEPIEGGPLEQMRGHINVENSQGDADIAIPIAGPHGSAVIYTEAYRSLGEWNYTRMVVEVDQTGEWTDILP